MPLLSGLDFRFPKHKYMQNFQLTEFCHIKGIGSASGLIYYQDVLFVISDNSTFLYQYVIDKDIVLKFPLVENPQENIDKKDKLDLEAITNYGNQIFIFGSGSTSKRNTMFSVNLENDALHKNDLSHLYQILRDLASLKEDELNIEGAICINKTMLLFQRGNGANNKNGIFIVPDNPEQSQGFVTMKLPEISNVETTFTDAILVDDIIYFLAAAEDTVSTYEDGEVLGSIIGKMNAETFEIIETQIISISQKFEGITLYKNNENEITFLLCEDNDSDILESKIYKASFTK